MFMECPAMQVPCVTAETDVRETPLCPQSVQLERRQAHRELWCKAEWTYSWGSFHRAVERNNSGRETVPIGKIREHFREDVPFVMGFQGWVSVQKTQTGGAEGPAWAESWGWTGCTEHPVSEWSSVTCVLETEGLGQKGSLEPESWLPGEYCLFSVLSACRTIRGFFEQGMMTWWLADFSD